MAVVYKKVKSIAIFLTGLLILSSVFVLLLSRSGTVRFAFVAILLTLAAAITGRFAAYVGVNAQVKIGVEMHLYSGIMLTYLSNPWVGVVSIVIGFYLMNRVPHLIDCLLRLTKPQPWVFVEGLKDLSYYAMLYPSMWLYLALLFIIPPLSPFFPPLLLWNGISFIASCIDTFFHYKFQLFEGREDIGRAPWKRFIFYLILFSSLSPYIISFVSNGPA